VRLAYDKDSGKARGFGFAEYFDIESAEAAQRHLDGQNLRGRPLRLDFAPDDGAPRGGGGLRDGGGPPRGGRDPVWDRAGREGPPMGMGE